MSSALLSDPHPGADNIHVALEYAAAGIAVFPCWEAAGFDARGNPKKAKEPYTPHGFKDASTQEMQIRRWWKEHPHAIVGIACGAAGLFVIDCDVKNKDADGNPINGINNYIEIAKTLGIEPTHTATISTPSGGLHSIYAMPESGVMPNGKLPGNSANAKTGIDTRGDGGYIFAPGSVMADGTRYAAIGPDLLALRRAGKLPVMPLGLPDAVRPQKAAGKPLDAPAAAPGPPPSAAAQPPRSPTTERELIVAKAALADECAAVAACPAGGRNDRLNIAAHSMGTLIGAAWLDRPTAEAALSAAAIQNGSVADDGEQQARATIRKGIEAGILKPRGPLAANDPALVAGMADTVGRMIASHGATPPVAPTTIGASPIATPQLWTSAEFVLAESGSYVIKGLLAPGNVGVLLGHPNAGKSTLASHVAYAVAQGRPLFGRRTRAGRVLYLTAEDARGTKKRLYALGEQYGHTHDVQVMEISDLRTVASQAAVAAAIAAVKPALIVLDTLPAAFAGMDENHSGDMGAAVAWLLTVAKAGAAVLAVAHPAKAADGGKGGAATARGHGSLHGMLDVCIVLDGGDPTDADTIVRGSLTKNRNGSTAWRMAFKKSVIVLGRDEEGDNITTTLPVEEDADANKPVVLMTKQQEKALMLLRHLIMQHNSSKVTEDMWRNYCEDQKLSTSDNSKTRREAFSKAFEVLLERGRIIVGNGNVWLPTGGAG